MTDKQRLSWVSDTNCYPILLFLDAQCLMNNKFNFDNPSFKTIKNFIDLQVLKIISTKVIRKEVYNNVFNVLNEAKRKLNGKINENIVSNSIFNSDFLPDNIYNNFIEDFNLTDITDNVDISMIEILDDYFDKIPPFNKKTSEKKKEEFPDAFNIECIKKYTSDKKCIVISNDSDYTESFKKENNIYLFSKIQEFVDELLKEKNQ